MIRWLIAKYVEDVRRQEPRNIGVVLFTTDNVLFKFVGQRQNGSIDGRRSRFARSLETYKAWVKYWREEAVRAAPGVLPEHLLRRSPDQNYYLDSGGERIHGEAETDARELLDSLYAMLVQKEADDEQYGNVAELSEGLLEYLGLANSVTRDYRLAVNGDSPLDTVTFDYRYDNGRVNLMRTVTLAHAGKRSWELTHAAAWDLEQARGHQVAENQQTVALIKPRDVDAELERQVALLHHQADAIVNVAEDTAADDLAGVLGLDRDAVLA